MKTRDELEKMNKCSLIELILANELLPKVHNDKDFRSTGLTLGQVSYVEEVGKSIADQRTAFHPIIHSTIDELTEELIITVPSMAKASKDRRAAAKARQAEADLTVIYRPVGFDQKPFIFNGKRYDRDELRAMGRDFQAHDAIHDYVEPA